MRKAGGIIVIIASIFGVIAALITLSFGGISSALDLSGGDLVLLLGWGGLVFSALNIVLGAICIGVKGKASKILIILSSIAGIFLGGTFVAVCMILALAGGIVALFDKE